MTTSDKIDRSQWGLYTIHLMRRSRCFVLDNFARTARFLLRQNQSVQLRLICIYVCPTSAHRGFRYGYRRCKDSTFTLKTTLFGWKSMILRSDSTLSNINRSKNSTFAWFFLLKSLYYQWLFVSSQRQSSPSLLTMLKSCEAFFVYTHLNMANLIPFTKRFESSENLVNLLESRGLQICDRNKAIQFLDNILLQIVCLYVSFVEDAQNSTFV